MRSHNRNCSGSVISVGGSGAILPLAASTAIVSGSCSEYSTAIRGFCPSSAAISSTISRVQSTDLSQPEVPQDPMSNGIVAAWRACIKMHRSDLIAAREYLETPVARYAGPLSVDPASQAMTWAPAATPRATSPSSTPRPSAPIGTRTFVKSSFEFIVFSMAQGGACLLWGWAQLRS